MIDEKMKREKEKAAPASEAGDTSTPVSTEVKSNTEKPLWTQRRPNETCPHCVRVAKEADA